MQSSPKADHMIMHATEACQDCNHFKPLPEQYLLFEVPGTNYYRNLFVVPLSDKISQR